MTLEESREVIPMLEDMIKLIEEYQELMAEMYLELEQRDSHLLKYQEQNQELQYLNSKLLKQHTILPSKKNYWNCWNCRMGG